MKRIPDYLSQAIWWLGYSLTGITVPVLIGLIVSAGLRHSVSLGSFTNGGQFALYSAGMLTTTFYCIGRPNRKRLKFSELIGLLCILFFAIAVAFFAMAVLYANGQDMAVWITEWPTISLFGVSAIITFVAVLIDKKRESLNVVDLEQINESKVEALRKKFRKTAKR